MSQQLTTPEPPVIRQRSARPAAPGRHHKSSAALIHEAEEAGFVRQHRGKLIIAGVLALGLVIYFFPKPGPGAPVRKAEKIVTVQLPPPPPPKLPPPPPPKVQPPPEKMEKAAPAEDKPKEAAPKKADAPPPTALATGIKGDGPGLGLASSGNGLGGGNSIGGQTGNGGGSKWGTYPAHIQERITAALRAHPKTRSAVIGGLQVRIWPDATGRVTRATLASSTNNADLDAAIEAALSGVQLREAPPAGMKLPIVLRLSARRPN